MLEKQIAPKLAMLEELDFSANPVIYHYCAMETFLSIIEKKTFRLSDINSMNDFSEMHWAYRQFIQAANLDGKEYDPEFLGYIDILIGSLQLGTLPLVGCFSKDGDVLSQWRAYANNGAGVSIGFDAGLIRDLSVRCAPVEYRPEKQIEYFSDLLASALPVWATDQQKESWFLDYVHHSAFDMCLMKNPAFVEEQEVRIVRAVTITKQKGAFSNADHGGVGLDKLAKKKHPIKFRVRDGGLIAHIDLSLGMKWRQIIKKIVIGPRSSSGQNEISMALSANGFENFEISGSTATYR